MKRKFYKELWSERFVKMLRLEEQSVVDYQALLDEIQKNHPGHAMVPHLQRLVGDEKKHALLVKELLTILERQVV